MKKSLLKKTALLGTAVLASLGVAQAHRAWFLPSTFVLSGDEQWITVDAAVSNDLFYPNHRPMRSDGIIVTAPDGSTVDIVNAVQGEIRTAFDVKLDQQGTYRIADGGIGYFAAWEEDGERQRKRGSFDEIIGGGYAEKPGAEITQSYRRIETMVTLGAPSTDNLSMTGKGLELDPVSHPNDIVTGEPATFGFFRDGEPAAGIEVTIVRGDDRYRDKVDEQKLTTDESGQVSFTMDAPGTYWLETEAEGEVTVEGITMTQRLSYVLTFEVLDL
ncbi:DUF4198 domain-containing protein [Parvularcula sp. LCG005]|uniref:DUF4198 domain-containing protein n=1 Tax=Parvularcula sp. LCG005 TaxID=3078805 RepID=UPI0029422079|nr:DUF4198 domain-containing protein [Parvularcula sp. LCG005]WOI52340.1 DUF4198 domain-containing protein [Parvularcula sp. LCG005]